LVLWLRTLSQGQGQELGTWGWGRGQGHSALSSRHLED